MVTDNDMPLLNGVELLKKVRAARSGASGHHGHRSADHGRIRLKPSACARRRADQALYH